MSLAVSFFVSFLCSCKEMKGQAARAKYYANRSHIPLWCATTTYSLRGGTVRILADRSNKKLCQEGEYVSHMGGDKKRAEQKAVPLLRTVNIDCRLCSQFFTKGS